MNPLRAFLENQTVWVAVAALVTAQLSKAIFALCITRKFNPKVAFSTGGMPSSHSAFVVAMATSVAITEGLYSTLFAMAFVFAIIVMHDAAGVRRQAGKHAEVINMLAERLKKQGITLDEKLKELLGHSPIEVFAGALWGLLVALLAHNFPWGYRY